MLPNTDRFSNYSFTGNIISKFVMKWSLKIQPHHRCIAVGLLSCIEKLYNDGTESETVPDRTGPLAIKWILGVGLKYENEERVLHGVDYYLVDTSVCGHPNVHHLTWIFLKTEQNDLGGYWMHQYGTYQQQQQQQCRKCNAMNDQRVTAGS